MIRPRGLVLLLAAALSGPHAACAWAGGPVLDLPAGTVDLAWHGPTRINGMDMAIRLFEAPGAFPAVAARILRRLDAPPMLMALPDGLLMTGTYADPAAAQGGPAFWLLQLGQVDRHRTRGLLAVRPAVAAPAAARRPEWVPAQARLLLEMENDDDGRRTVLQVYDHADPLAVLSASVRERLRVHGWRQAGAGQAWSEWSQGRRRLLLALTGQGQGSGLVLQYGIDP